MFSAINFMHGERADWTKITHVKLRPGAKAETENGRDVLAHIRSVADANGVATIDTVLEGYPPKRRDLPLVSVAHRTLRHMANERSYGNNEINKGCVWLGRLEESDSGDDVDTLPTDTSATETDDLIAQAVRFRGGGEGDAHKALKVLASKNPQFFGVPAEAESYVEYSLPSGDAVDVMFVSEARYVGVEVKSKISTDPDLVRGLFQCIKYPD